MTDMDHHTKLAKAEALLGAGLMATPVWAIVVLQYVSLLASVVASVCGAILGVHAVWRLWKRPAAPTRD